MKFGLHLFGHHDKSKSAVDNFETVVEQGNAAREANFDLLWMGHHFLVSDNHKFQAVPALGRIAANSGDMRLGTSYLLPLEHPIVLAEQFATLDAITGGRIILAPVMGYRNKEFDALEIDKSDRLGRLIEGVQIIKRLWTEDNVSYDGKHFQFEDVTIEPKPVQDPRPPIWIGGNKDKAIERAGKMGDVWIANPHEDEPTIARQVNVAGQPSGDGYHGVVPGRRDVFVAETDAKALEIYGPQIKNYYDWYVREGQAEAMENPGALDQRLEDLKEDRFIIGSPETVTDRLVNLYENVGLDCILMGMHRPGIPHSDLLRSIELVGEEVIPAVRERIDAE